MRWLKEWWRPSVKCERVGHDERTRRRTGYQWPGKSYRSVADEVEVEFVECCRCGKMLSSRDEFRVLSRSGIQSLSMSSADWRRLKRDGVLLD